MTPLKGGLSVTHLTKIRAARVVPLWGGCDATAFRGRPGGLCRFQAGMGLRFKVSGANMAGLVVARTFMVQSNITRGVACGLRPYRFYLP